MYYKQKDKNALSFMRVMAVVLAILISFSSIIVFASEEKQSVSYETQEIQIEAVDRFLTIEEAEEADLLEGVTATDKDGNDYSEYLSVVKSVDFDAAKAGKYTLSYFVIIDEVTIATKDVTVTIISDYKIEADKLVVQKDTPLEDIDFLKDVTVVDAEGNNISKELEVDYSNVNTKETGEYISNYTLTIDNVIVAHMDRKVIVEENNVQFFAPNLSLFTNALKDGENHKKSILGNISATGSNGENYTPYIEVINDDNGGDFTKRGKYNVSYAVVKDGEVLATTTRKVAVDPVSLRGATTQTLGGNISQDKLKVDVQADGMTAVHREMNGSWIRQYFSTNANGLNLKIGNEIHSLSAYWGISDLVSIDVGALQRDVYGNQSVTRTYSISGGQIIVKELITVDKGADNIKRTWTVTNHSGADIIADENGQSARLIYGGDTYFSGYDNGWANYKNTVGQTVYVYRAADQGTMSLKGDITTPADDYFAGYYFSGYELAVNADLSDPFVIGQTTGDEYPDGSPYIVNKASGPNPRAPELPEGEYWTYTGTMGGPYVNSFEYVDTGYYLQWNKTGNFANNDSWTIKSYEIFSSAGDIQLSSEGTKEAPPGTMVTHNFTVANQSIDESKNFKVNFTAISENGWATQVIPSEIPNFATGEETTVSVNVWIPEKNGTIDFENGFEDALKLKADYVEVGGTETGTKIADSATKTLINKDLATITSVPITYLDAKKMNAQVNFINTEAERVQFRLTIQNTDYSSTGLTPTIATLTSGSEFMNVDVSKLTAGKTYRLLVEAVDKSIIPYPHNSTTFVMGKNLIPPTKLVLNPKNVLVMLNESYDGFITTLSPSNVTETEKKILWFSSDDSIASIDRNTGLVTGLTEGTVTITARAESNPDQVYDTATVNVKSSMIEVNSKIKFIQAKRGKITNLDIMIANFGITAREYNAITRTWTNITLKTGTVGNIEMKPNPNLNKVGNYNFSLRIKDSQGNWSESISLNMQVM